VKFLELWENVRENLCTNRLPISILISSNTISLYYLPEGEGNVPDGFLLIVDDVSTGGLEGAMFC
jgi:hypothetical protein